MFPATFLAALEEDLGRPLWQYFDLISGTSTGGIIAIGLAMGIPASEIRDLYEKEGPRIFAQDRDGIRGWMDRKRASWRWAFNGPKHSSEYLESELQKVLGERRLGEAKTRLVIPAFHTTTKRVYIFKTAHHERLTTDYKVLARDAAMSTAAAPTYFKEFVTNEDVGLVDGGMWANNPTGVAVVEGVGTLEWAPRDISVLSLGCLEEVDEMPSSTGALQFARKMSGYFMAGQSHGSLGLAHVLTGDVGASGHKAIYRVSQPIPPGFYTLDDTSRISKLKDRALDEVRRQKPDLLKVFFQETAPPFSPVYGVLT